MSPESMLHRKRVFLKQALLQQDQTLFSNKTLKSDLKSAHNELYSKSKPIRVTDDDYSTIIVSLGKLYGKISNFPPNCKSVLKTTTLLSVELPLIINQLFDDSERIRQLVPDDKVDYALIGILVEKYVTETIIREVFEKGIHLDARVNDGFHALGQLFEASGHEEWVKELRLRSARATYELLEKRDPGVVEAIAKGKQRVVEHMVKDLGLLYADHSVIQPRIEKMVDMAAKLCLPLHGQDVPVEVYWLSSGDPVIEKQVKRVYKPLGGDDESKIYVSIAPVFLAKSIIPDDDIVEDCTYKPNYTLVYAGRAIW